MTTVSSVLVVGASVAGLSVAEALRREKYAGKISLLGDERHLPYDRPPLSKKVLAGEWEPGKTQLRQESALSQLDSELILGDAAVRLDVAERQVHTASGRVLQADVIVLATGLRPRRLPGQEQYAGIHVLHTLEDSIAIRADLLAYSKVVVVGDGVLGTEIAATARSMGRSVTLVGPQSAPLSNHVGPTVAQQLGRLHADRGVELRLGEFVEGFEGSNGRVNGVRLKSGEVLSADMVVVAIGAKPAIDWLQGSGLSLGDGIVCDSRCRAADAIYAAGDVARWHHEGFGAQMRLENRSNAVEQAMAVAANIMGKDKAYSPVPFFWTDQYEVKVHVHGSIAAGAEVKILEGDPASGQFVAAFGHGGKVCAVLGWNMVKQCRQHRRHVVDATAWNEIAG